MIGPIFISSQSQQVWKRKLGQSNMIFVQKMRMKREDQVLIFWQFFSTCEPITQFLEFCKYQGGKIYVKPFEFLLQIRTIR